MSLETELASQVENLLKVDPILHSGLSPLDLVSLTMTIIRNNLQRQNPSQPVSDSQVQAEFAKSGTEILLTLASRTVFIHRDTI